MEHSRTAIVLPLVVLSVVALLLFAKPLAQNEVLSFRDHFDYFQPLRMFTATELRRGHLPLWNPYNASGEPWLANPQTAVFYPPAWLFLILPFAPAYTLFLALHVALLGCGAMLLFRRFASRGGAFVAALSLMLCGPVLSLLDVSNTLTTFAWIPLVLWCAAAGASPVLSAGVIAMSFLAGEPFFAALAALMFVLIRRRRDVLDTAATAFAVSAVQLFPFLAFVRQSDRAGSVAAEEILRDSMPLGDWFRAFIPPTLAPGTPQQQFIPVVYIGFIAAILAIVGIIAGRRLRFVHVAVAAFVLSALLAAGSHFPPSGWLLTHLPVTLLRYPARMVPLAALAIHALAAVGFDAVSRVARYSWLPLLAAAIIVVDLTPAIAPLMQSDPYDPHPGPYAPYIARDGKLIRFMREQTTRWGFDRHTWISGYLNLFERRLDAWTAAPVVSQAYGDAYRQAIQSRAAFDALGAMYVLSDRPVSGLVLMARWREVLLYRNPQARPLAYWVGDDGRIERAGMLAFTTRGVNITVDAPADGTVVITQQNAPGWRVVVDEHPAAPLRVGIFRGVRVTRGHHAIAWRYRPSSFLFGAMFTVIGLLRMLLSPIFVKARAREKNFFDRS